MTAIANDPAVVPAAATATTVVAARRATRITAAFALLLAAIIVVDVTLLGMGAGATFGTCLTATALFAGRRFRRRVLGRA